MSGILCRRSAKEGYQSAGVMYVALQGRGPRQGAGGAVDALIIIYFTSAVLAKLVILSPH